VKLIIENFKCFYKASVPLNHLTVLAGANGNGKSTALQALLYLRRTIEHCAQWKDKRYELNEVNGLNVELNGAYCLALGNSDLVLPRNSNSNSLFIGVVNNEKKFIVEYSSNESDLWLTPEKVTNENAKDSSLFLQEFYYLNAERIGPRIAQGIKFYDFPNAGFQGEYVAQLISDTDKNYRLEITKERRHPKRKSPRLEQQVNAWLDELMPGVSIIASYDPNTHSAQIKIDNYFTQGDPTISTNIGFGISYVLPIIVTGLIAKEGSFMIVENPEAHLHPSAQSKIGRFLSMIAKSGVKVIIETHSDHVLNGIQIAAAKGEINNEWVTINYFTQPSEPKPLEKSQPKIETISINKKGELSSWPKGFFDQTQIDFAELFKIRKG
jgi:predicted ATPase